MQAFSTLLAFAGNFAFASGNRSTDQLFDDMTFWVQFLVIAAAVTFVCWQLTRQKSDE
jgi:hypothetical protein